MFLMICFLKMMMDSSICFRLRMARVQPSPLEVVEFTATAPQYVVSSNVVVLSVPLSQRTTFCGRSSIGETPHTLATLATRSRDEDHL